MDILLQKGSKGEQVKQLQKFFGITADGIFGNQTLNKVMEWQKQNNLRADGLVTKNMWEKIFPSTKTALKLENLVNVIPDSVINELKTISQITTPLRLAHFLSQCSHESNNFKLVRENLNYSYQRLLEVFKSKFDTNNDHILTESEKNKAKEIANNPEKIANYVYANRGGNGNELSGDGWKYRGRGYIQLTLKNNYREFNKIVSDNILENPDLVATKYPLLSAVYFFNKNNLWEICDAGGSEKDIQKLTKKINGGLNGIEDRIKLFNKFYKLVK